uniref:Uncharacterized protein n=1 Tax=Arundo donax TaxID=35708 RepID=A0A0A9HKU6_ARUDO
MSVLTQGTCPATTFTTTLVFRSGIGIVTSLASSRFSISTSSTLYKT